MEIKLIVDYRTPSLNRTKRQHWAVQSKTQKEAWSALLCALWAIGYGPLTQTISPEARKICLMGCDTLASFLMTGGKTSGLKRSRKRCLRSTKNARRST